MTTIVTPSNVVVDGAMIVDGAGVAVSSDNPLSVSVGDSPSVDAFSRLRVSSPYAQFAAFNEYKINPFNWVTATSGTGTATHSTSTKFVTLATGGTASGARAVMQSRAYLRYTPGKSLFVAMTFLMGAKPGANCSKRAGYFDDSNGIFLDYTSAGTRVVLRSSVGGSVVDTAYAQSSWNIDKLDGTGTSGITLDLSKGQILWMDFQFLGMGRVRFGFDINGVLVPVHELNHANITATQPYMATANLPVRFEIINTGTAAQSETMGAFCAKVDSEGGFDLNGIQYSASNGVTGVGLTTTLKPLVSIRPGPTFNGITNRGWVVPMGADLYVDNTTSVLVYYQIIWNATLTGSSWAAVNTNAMGQYDVSATAVSLGSGAVIEEGVFPSSSNTNKLGYQFNDIFSSRPLVNSFDGTTPDTLTIAARVVSGTATAAYGSFTWHGHW